jgi:putative glutamine amidotransferase
MTRIGLTQRVETVKTYEERRDCLDQRWGPLMQSFGVDPIPLFNQTADVDTYVDRLDLDGIVLTGGNDLASLADGSNVAPERDQFERTLLETAIDRKLPVLGVCRGLQLLNVYCGGSIHGIDDHVAIEHDLEIDQKVAPIAVSTESVAVNSYHSYGVADQGLGDQLAVAGRAPDGSIEWVEHTQYPITAIMWHPERESPSTALDQRIINNRLPTESV